MIDPRAIASLPVFADLTPAAIHALADRAVERTFAKDQVLFTAGSPAMGLWLILQGRVRVVRGRGGRQHLIHDECPGGALGEVPVFAGGAYPATAIAAEESRCLLLSTAALRDAVRADPDVAFLFLKRLSERVRHLVDRIDRFAGQGVNGRLARFLLECDRTAPEGIFPLGSTQVEVAEELGTVREVVVRALRELRAYGIIEAAGRGRYRVVNRPRLRALAE